MFGQKQENALDFRLQAGDSPETLPERRTYVICGMPRGGTTMVAGVCALLGLDIGKDLPGNLEDPDFNLDRLGGGFDKVGDHIRAAIAERNAQQAVWGWKYPNAPLYLPQVQGDLINPHLIFVFRDFPAQSQRASKRQGKTAEVLLGDYIARLQHIQAVIQAYDGPSMLLSYEKCLSRSDAFITEMARFLGAPEPDAALRKQIGAFMAPGAYKKLNALR